ncbi:outer membrane protein transport protein [Paraburkholderia xenovorans]|uniref:OmpP1/FadL family transporter n=1 Tax=Paraburkholderia xenovorans TaxID=36873 RepID=UPI0038B8BE55
MMTNIRKACSQTFALKAVAITLFSWGATPSFAVDGAQLSSFGVIAGGMAGVSIALPQDSVSAANNPAGMGVVGSRFDFGLQGIEPQIDYEYGSANNHLHSGGVSVVPEGGFNLQINPRVTFGVSLFGVGLAANYGSPALSIPGAQIAKSSLQAMAAAPTVTYKFNEQNIIGLSVVLAYERFSAEGIILPDESGGLTTLPSHGVSRAFGYGGRIGYLWKPVPNFTLGAMIATTIRMGRLSGYDNDILAAGGGRIDVPPEYGIGVSYEPVPALKLAADWLHISWSKTILGSAQTFSWKDQDVFRIGASYDISRRWTIRAGFSYANPTFNSNAVAQNFLTPIENGKTVSAGFTYRVSNKDEISALFEYGIPVNMHGTGPSEGFNVKTTTEVIGITYGHKF